MKIVSYYKVFPNMTNWQPYKEKGAVVFGGAAFSEADELGATLCKKCLFESKSAEYAVTWKYDGDFLTPVGTGDLIRLEAEVVSFEGKGKYEEEIKLAFLQKRTIEVLVKGYLETENGDKLFSKNTFVFVTKEGSRYADHGLQD